MYTTKFILCTFQCCVIIEQTQTEQPHGVYNTKMNCILNVSTPNFNK